MPQQAVRFPDDLHSAIKAEADRRGKPHTFSSVLIEVATVGLASVLGADPRPSVTYDEAQARHLAAEQARVLEAVLSEAKGAATSEQSGPAPVPSSESDGVRPAAQPRTHGKDKPDLMQALKASLDGLRSNGHLQTCKCWRCEKLDGAA